MPTVTIEKGDPYVVDNGEGPEEVVLVDALVDDVKVTEYEWDARATDAVILEEVIARLKADGSIPRY